MDLFRKKSISGILSEVERGDRDASGSALSRALTVRDLTALGIAAIVGAGIFSTIGNAAAQGGPAVSILFIFTAVACGFSALCYAEFASMIPISGSAYTYAYASFGELVAWIIGWDLLIEYAIGNVAVAISWSDYFTGFLSGLGIRLPEYLTMDFLTALRGYDEAIRQMATGTSMANLPWGIREAFLAWQNAPRLGSVRLVADVPALAVTILITYLIYVGIRESRNVNNIMVGIKMLVILMVIVVGFFYVNPANWDPFAPHGVAGVLKGVSAVFFAYIGFDAISTTAEECQNPQRDLPRGMFYSLVICTALYVLISLVLTGMVHYADLAVGDPMAYVFKKAGLDWLSGVVALSAIVAMASVLLAFQLGQPRIWMSMSRDGLLPKIFSRIHPKHKTPSFSTILTGFCVGIPALFMNLTEMTDLTSIGTLFAFALVCGGVLVLQNDPDAPPRKFKIYYVNGRWVLPVILSVIGLILWYQNPDMMNRFLSLSDPSNPSATTWEVFQHKIPIIVFIGLTVVVLIWTIAKKLSLIPVLGLLSCAYLMTELGITNWFRFFAWLAIGLVIYFSYSYRSSRLNLKKAETGGQERRMH